jgi:hypothetical protein
LSAWRTREDESCSCIHADGRYTEIRQIYRQHIESEKGKYRQQADDRQTIEQTGEQTRGQMTSRQQNRQENRHEAGAFYLEQTGRQAASRQ